jgi:hypothetical protein
MSTGNSYGAIVPITEKTAYWTTAEVTLYKGEIAWELPDDGDVRKAYMLVGDGDPVNPNYTRLRVSGDNVVVTYNGQTKTIKQALEELIALFTPDLNVRNANISQTATIGGMLNAQSGAIVSGNKLEAKNGLEVTGNESVSGNLSAASATITGNETVNGKLTAGSATITGNETVGGHLTVASETVSGALSAGNTTINGNESVSGNLSAASATISGNETVNGKLTASSAEITGNETVGGHLTVASETVSGALSAGNTTINGNESVSGNLSAASATISGTLTASSATITGSLTANSAEIANALVVKDIIASGNVEITGTLEFANANVTGNITAGSSVINGTETVNGKLEAKDGLEVTGNETVNGNETVSGALSAGSATITGNETVGGKLTASSAEITGNETVGGNLSAASATITGNETVNGNLTAGSATITGNETVGGSLTANSATINGTLTAGSAAVSGITNLNELRAEIIKTALIKNPNGQRALLQWALGNLTIGNMLDEFSITSSARPKVQDGIGTHDVAYLDDLIGNILFQFSVYAVGESQDDPPPINPNVLPVLDERAVVKSWYGTAAYVKWDGSAWVFDTPIDKPDNYAWEWILKQYRNSEEHYASVFLIYSHVEDWSIIEIPLEMYRPFLEQNIIDNNAKTWTRYGINYIPDWLETEKPRRITAADMGVDGVGNSPATTDKEGFIKNKPPLLMDWQGLNVIDGGDETTEAFNQENWGEHLWGYIVDGGDESMDSVFRFFIDGGNERHIPFFYNKTYPTFAELAAAGN